MNWWMIAAGLAALVCAAGHVVVGWSIFDRPIRSAIISDLHGGIFDGMWHLITINFALSALALLALGAYGRGDAAAWLVAAQFAGYAGTYLIISLRLGRTRKLLQWVHFAATAILAGAGAVSAH